MSNILLKNNWWILIIGEHIILIQINTLTATRIYSKISFRPRVPLYAISVTPIRVTRPDQKLYCHPNIGDMAVNVLKHEFISTLSTNIHIISQCLFLYVVSLCRTSRLYSISTITTTNTANNNNNKNTISYNIIIINSKEN